MEILYQYIETISENFFDPKKRVFLGYLLSAFLISFMWLTIVKKEKIKQSIKKIFDKKIFMSKSAKADYLLFLLNIVILMFLSPLLISQLAIAHIVFEYLHSQTILMPLDIETNYIWMIPIFFTLCYFILDDFTKYITHALMHKVPLLWEIHKTHHSARTLTPLTIFRTHPIEGVIFVLRSALTQGIVIATFYYVYGGNITFVTILGANLFSFWFHLLGSNLRHSHIRINYWHWLEKVLISPAQHQIHHSVKKEHHNKNFGVAFAFWDYMFGSLYVSKSNEDVKFGISEKEHKYENNIIYLYLSPFIGIYKIISNSVSLTIINLKKYNIIFNKQTR
tara:strand:+ start:107 stop:1114 length:1008 start_codon:yes stop_codon:yes gene_type:complete